MKITPPSSLEPIYGGTSEKEQLKAAATQFESLFLSMVLESMRKTIPKSDLVDGGNAEDIYRSMLDTQYALHMAKEGRTGLSEKITEQMGKLLETKGNAAYKLP